MAPKLMRHLAVLLALAGVGFCMAAYYMQGKANMSWLLAGALAGFGLYKGSLGIEAWLGMRDGTADHAALVQAHGDGLRSWMIFKLVVMFWALAAAVVLLVLGLRMA